jgi:hypothetical protein
MDDENYHRASNNDIKGSFHLDGSRILLDVFDKRIGRSNAQLVKALKWANLMNKHHLVVAFSEPLKDIHH